jgi:hypothetical protein
VCGKREEENVGTFAEWIRNLSRPRRVNKFSFLFLLLHHLLFLFLLLLFLLLLLLSLPSSSSSSSSSSNQMPTANGMVIVRNRSELRLSKKRHLPSPLPFRLSPPFV